VAPGYGLDSGMMAWRGVLGALVIVGVSGCGGDEFGDSGSGGAAGSGGTTSTGGAAGSGGTTSTGGAAGSGGTTSTGGTAGVGGTTNTGGTGGSVPHPCGAPTGVTTLLYSTLDDDAGIKNPAIIKSGSGQYNGNFIQDGVCGKAFRVGATGEYANWPAQNNVNTAKGTLDFYMLPHFNTSDGLQHRLVGIPGQLNLTKTDAAGGNQLLFGLGPDVVATVDPANVPFVSGTWVRITVTWDLSTPSQIAFIYFDGQAATLATSLNGTKADLDFSGGPAIWVGAFAANGNVANADFDDFKVYDSPQAP
jgi:hypothetical protein